MHHPLALDLRDGTAPRMRLAVFYDYLRTIGGGERVALTLARDLHADLITTDLDPSLPTRAGFPGVRPIDLGGLVPHPPFKQIQASGRFLASRFEGYDAHVFVGNWAHFAAARHHPNMFYCLTPTRAFYDQRDAVLGRLRPVNRLVARAWIGSHGPFDRWAVRHCDRIVGISDVVRSRVRKYYHRDAQVIHPPVATSRFRFEEIGDTWLSVSRLYPEKRIGLQLDIFRRLPEERLVIVGGYSPGDRAERYLATLHPPPNVTLWGEIDEDRLRGMYGRCRGFLTTAVDEDFGITPVEAMAAGKVVLATDEGGYRETVLHGRTGFLLPPNPEAFVQRIQRLDESTLRSMRDACVARAREFDETLFTERMRAALAS
jgi:glycosyltransferase involved in cell wall biosynthesis